MPRLQLNKSSLARETRELQSYQRYLPSLDLKRQQLMAERAKVVQLKHDFDDQLDAIYKHVKIQLPMVANTEIELDQLVQIDRIEVAEENVVGVLLPSLSVIEINTSRYSLLAKPHWVDAYVKQMAKALELQVRVSVQVQREEKLSDAIKTITQRVNLFEKVLIPQARKNIKRIKIYLSDEQMASVVRSKIAKKKRLQSVEAS